MTIPAPSAAKQSGPVDQDFTACDREPIHMPGSIQPHGLLLIADPSSLTVIAGAGRIETALAPDWLGRTLPDLLGLPVAADLSARPSSVSIALGRTQGKTTMFDVTAHGSPGALLVELEPAPASMPSLIDGLAAMEEATATFEQAFGLGELCERAAKAFRHLTGFDRVMVYRFLDDDAGVVLGEDRDPTLSTYLNQHFPASDIPKQACALCSQPCPCHSGHPLRTGSHTASRLCRGRPERCRPAQCLSSPSSVRCKHGRRCLRIDLNRAGRGAVGTDRLP